MSASPPDSKLSWHHHLLISLLKHGPIPHHIGLIMDGNRRYARERSLPDVLLGHSAGFDTLMTSLELCLELGVSVVTVYAFSEENFLRTREEVQGLMDLAGDKFKIFLKAENLVMQKGVVVDVWGRVELLREDVRQAAARAVLGTMKNGGKATLNVCFGYSGTEELCGALRGISEGLVLGMIEPRDVDEELISKCTYLRDLPKPQLLIRTSGETRLSDFMLWHLPECKFVFLDVLWPDLSFWHLVSAVCEWQDSVKAQPRAIITVTPNERTRKFLAHLKAQQIKKWELLLKS